MKQAQKPAVAVALTRCFYCGGPSDIVLNSLLTPKVAAQVEEMNGKVISMEPCQACKAWMEKGVILISCRDEDEGSKEPWRTGNWAVVTDEYIRHICPPEAAEPILKNRWAFVPDKAWNILHLPTPATDGDHATPDPEPQTSTIH